MRDRRSRAQLHGEIERLRDLWEREQREVSILRKEMQGVQERAHHTYDENRRLQRDRDRLTATIEVLARRIASDVPIGVHSHDQQAWEPRH